MGRFRDDNLRRPTERKCALCRHRFIPAKGWHRFCGATCRNEAVNKPKRIAMAEWFCTYCGQIGDSIDHVPPQSIRPILVALGLAEDYPSTEVRSCRECNCALGDDGGWTVRERKRTVKVWLQRRYARLLCMPEWTPEELLELGPGLLTHVSSGVVQRRLIERRLKW